MPQTMPPRASLAWLKKSAKQYLREWRGEGREVKLADAQLTIARQYGFSSWRALKAHVDRLQTSAPTIPPGIDDGNVARFLRHVGNGDIDLVRSALAADTQ